MVIRRFGAEGFCQWKGNQMIGRGYCTCVYRKPKRERNDGFGVARPFLRATYFHSGSPF